MDEKIIRFFIPVYGWEPWTTCEGKKTALPTLKFKFTAPPAMFYADRAAFSEMYSPNLEKILGRKRHTVEEAVRLEFE